MQFEILQFALCHLFLSFPADFVPPWLLSGNTYAKTLIRATYCDSPSRPNCWSNLPDDHTATSSECIRQDCIRTLFRCTVSNLFFSSIFSINHFFSAYFCEIILLLSSISIIISQIKLLIDA